MQYQLSDPTKVQHNLNNSNDRRERLEQCDAALCPSVAYQLSGAKKVQQDLARPEVLERFLGDDNQV